jgi:hypothetical protein
MATKRRPDCRTRMTIMPCESWMVMLLRSLSLSGEGVELGNEEEMMELVVLGNGW